MLLTKYIINTMKTLYLSLSCDYFTTDDDYYGCVYRYTKLSPRTRGRCLHLSERDRTDFLSISFFVGEAVKSKPLLPQCVLIDLVSIGSKTQQDFILTLHIVVHKRDSLMTRCVSKGKLAATLTMWSMVFVSKFFAVARMWVALTQRMEFGFGGTG